MSFAADMGEQTPAVWRPGEIRRPPQGQSRRLVASVGYIHELQCQGRIPGGRPIAQIGQAAAVGTPEQVKRRERREQLSLPAAINAAGDQSVYRFCAARLDLDPSDALR